MTPIIAIAANASSSHLGIDGAPTTTRLANEASLKAAQEEQWRRGHAQTLLLSTQVIGAIAGLALLLALLCYLRRPRPTVPAAKGSGGDGDGEDGTPGKAPRRRPPHIAFVSRLQAWSASLAHFALPALRALYRNSNHSSSSSSTSSEMNIMPTELRRMAAATVAAGGERQDRESGVSSPAGPRDESGLSMVLCRSAPTLLGSTSQPATVLSAEALMRLRAELPLRFNLCAWCLLFSTDQHGCSLRTLYNRVEGRDGTLLVVLDGQGQIFGAFVSEPWQPSFIGQRAYFGNGETFVYRVDQSEDTAITYGWTRQNHHFVLADVASVSFGSYPAAIYLDSSLEYGSCGASSTFDNERLCGTANFKCIKVELWGFQH